MKYSQFLNTKGRKQRGATLIVGVILLTLITVVVSTAFIISGSNLQAVGNVQAREEAIAVANEAIETAINSLNYAALESPPPLGNLVGGDRDIDNDGTDDFQVTVGPPACLQVREVGSTGPGSGSTAGIGILAPVSSFETLWELRADVTEVRSGAQLTIAQGVRLRVAESIKDLHCPTP